MQNIDASTLAMLWHDSDLRDERLREVISAALAENPTPRMDDAIVATYFFALRTQSLSDAVDSIAYHATTGIKHAPAGSLLAACTAKAAGVVAFDGTGRLGLLHVAYPLKMMLSEDGGLTSCDILHTTAAAIIFDVFENQDARLVSLQIPEHVLNTFPGPAHGPAGFRILANWPEAEPTFGTILKPTAGITSDDVGQLVENIAGCNLLAFIKEDEDLYPNLSYAPVGGRTRKAVAAIKRAKSQRAGRGLMYLSHVSSAPHQIIDTVHAAMEAGANGVMFSETFAGGTVRAVREAFKNLPTPPLIYGHNAGIGTRTRSIHREVIDMLARCDGIDFRQTAPVRPGMPFLKPYGAEWAASEDALIRPLGKLRPTTIVRAGSLDQGNIGLNLSDAESRGISRQVLFLAGSAINSITDDSGRANAELGAEAMLQAIEIHRNGDMRDIAPDNQVAALKDLAASRGLRALAVALSQRYPEGSK